MTYYNVLVLLLVFLVVWIPWLWRYYFKPQSAKAALKTLLKNHPEAKVLIEIEAQLNALYKNVPAKQVSHRERKRLGITEDAFVYGEIEFLPFYTILDRVKPLPHEVFYDLGSGSGKAVMAATAFFELSKVYGIELLPGLVTLANQQIKAACQYNPLIQDKMARVAFIQDDFVKTDFSDGDIVFINATCLSYPTWEKILFKLSSLKKGSRVIVTTKKIENAHFQKIYQGIDLMSWGMNSVNIYTKI